MLIIKRVFENQELSNRLISTITYADRDGVIDDPTLYFEIETYRDLSSCKTPELLDTDKDPSAHVFNSVNRFFAALSLADQKYIFDYYQWMRKTIDTLDPQNSHTVLRMMSEKTHQLCVTFELCKKAMGYALSIDIPYPDLTEAGSRVQDSKDMTFVLHEYEQLSAISLLCKIMSPVWGGLMDRLKHAVGSVDAEGVDKRRLITEASNKELFCFSIFIQSLRDSLFHDVIDKIERYLNTIVENTMNQRTGNRMGRGQNDLVQFNLSKNVFAEKRFQESVFAIIICKSTVWASMNDGPIPEGDIPNVMKYIHTKIQRTTLSKMRHLEKSSPFAPRHNVSEDMSGKDNITVLDNVARVSRVAMDIPILATVGIEMEVSRMLKDLGINKEKYERAMAFYRVTNIQPHTFNRAVISSLFASRIGGSRVLQYLRRPAYMSLLVLAQFYLVSQGYFELAMFMTSNTSASQRTDPGTTTDARISANLDKAHFYRSCTELFSDYSEKLVIQQVGLDKTKTKSTYERVGIKEQIGRVMEWLLNYTHLCNVSPVIWEEMRYEAHPMNDTLLEYTSTFMIDYCNLLLHIHTPKQEG